MRARPGSRPRPTQKGVWACPTTLVASSDTTSRTSSRLPGAMSAKRSRANSLTSATLRAKGSKGPRHAISSVTTCRALPTTSPPIPPKREKFRNQNRAMADSTSAFDRLVPRLEEIVARVSATPDGQDVQLARDDILVVLEVV